MDELEEDDCQLASLHSWEQYVPPFVGRSQWMQTSGDQLESMPLVVGDDRFQESNFFRVWSKTEGAKGYWRMDWEKAQLKEG